MKDNYINKDKLQVGGACLYFIREELRAEFLSEVKFARVRVEEIYPQVFLNKETTRLYWVLDYWPNLQEISFTSISDASKKIRAQGKATAYVGLNAFRRGALIADALKIKKYNTISFPYKGGKIIGGAFTLLDASTALSTSTPLKGVFAGGRMPFVEDKVGPPSRAYLKLWEIFTLTGFYPNEKMQALDLGATPGGWSYVAASLGARVTMIDRSAPDAALLKKFPSLQFIKADGLKPTQDLLNESDVILSDMACDVTKLFDSVMRWILLDKVRFIACTLKFHGVSDKVIIQKFAELPNSIIYHLWNNGHELTWIWQR